MIEKIDIESFGAFKDFRWTKNVSSKFDTLNIIYGRNYSGKTTLSRIFRSIEQKKLHTDFKNGNFKIDLSDKKSLRHSELDNTDLKVRVYNYDFKLENLSFLSNKDGEILPFAILGEQNVETENLISQKTALLDSTKLMISGNNQDLGMKKEVEKAGEKLDELKKGLDDKLRMKARNIKRDSKLFNISTKADYNIRDIKTELVSAKRVSSDELARLELILAEEYKSSILEISELSYKLTDYLEQSNELARKSISPSESIELLLDNPDLQEWVRQGINHHKDKRERCAFCNSELTTFIWDKLEAHFTKEAECHKTVIDNLIKEIEIHKKEVQSKTLNDKSEFYIEFQQDYQDLTDIWYKLKSWYLEDLDHLLGILTLRSSNIYNEYSLNKESIKSSSGAIEDCILNINNIIKMNNSYSDNISDKKENAIKKLRSNEIKKFIDEINFYEESKKIDIQNKIWIEKKAELKKAETTIRELELNIARLRSELNDELKAAEKVNEFLSVSLGHPEISLEVKKGEQGSTFIIKRNGDLAHNLSEGEQTLISFSYFLATLKDIPDNDKHDYKIFIDDPICSLDGNNIFYIFSLIDSEIVQDKYGQVFISTHNLDFLKYLQRAGKRKNYFMIERQLNIENITNSRLLDMPKYMRKYVTEFVFLFEQIYLVANEKQNDENYHIFYNFPNNARKFLESYLFFKYPNTKINNEERIKLFFKNSPHQVAFMQRISNEYSHGEEQFDRLSKPIDIPEFQKDALLILDTMRAKDNEQYNAFYNSIKR